MHWLDSLEFKKALHSDRIRRVDNQFRSVDDGELVAIRRVQTNAKPAVELTEATAEKLGVEYSPRSFLWTLNGPGRDRYGDRINNKSGWDLKSFKANPVLLRNHDHDMLPTGRVRNLFVDEQERLRGVVQIAEVRHNPDADYVYNQVRDGFLRAGSVGFIPLDYEDDEEEARAEGVNTMLPPLYFKRMELLEFSLVTVPAYREATEGKGFEPELIAKSIESETRTVVPVDSDLVADDSFIEPVEGKESEEMNPKDKTTGSEEVVERSTPVDPAPIDYNKLAAAVGQSVALALTEIEKAKAAKSEDAPVDAFDAEARKRFGVPAADVERVFKSHQEDEQRRSAQRTRARGIQDALKGYQDKVRTLARGQDKRFEGKGLIAARLLRAAALAKYHGGSAKDAALKHWGDRVVGEVLEMAFGEQRSVSTISVGSGGVFVPTEYSAELIEVLRSKVTIRNAGPVFVDMPTGSMTMGRRTADPDASYDGEGVATPISEPTSDAVQLVGKPLRSVTPVTNDWLLQTSISADLYIRNGMTSSIARREDRAYLRGNGIGDTPKGFETFALTANSFNANGTVTATNITEDLYKAIGAIATSDADGPNLAWFMSEREINYLRSLRGTSGEKWFPELQSRDNPMLEGFPVYATSQIPTNLGGGGNESKVYLANMDYVMVGDTYDMRVDFADGVAYNDGSGIVSAFQRDETVFRAAIKADMTVKHAEAVAMIEQTVWTA